MEYYRYMQPTIELCKTCNGDGLKYVFHEFDLLQQEPIGVTGCPTCEGSGRVIVSKKTVITVEPFENK